MTPGFAILAALVTVSAVAAMALRNLVHCALCLAVTFVGLAGLYLELGAQFVGLAQVLVYVGAVAIVIVFTILLTRSGEPLAGARVTSSGFWGTGIAAAVFAVMAWAILTSSGTAEVGGELDDATVAVASIGQRMMEDYVLPLEVLALLLTAAMIGAAVIALREEEGK